MVMKPKSEVDTLLVVYSGHNAPLHVIIVIVKCVSEDM